MYIVLNIDVLSTIPSVKMEKANLPSRIKLIM